MSHEKTIDRWRATSVPTMIKTVISATDVVINDPYPLTGDPKWFFMDGTEKIRIHGGACANMLRLGLLIKDGYDNDGCVVYMVNPDLMELA